MFTWQTTIRVDGSGAQSSFEVEAEDINEATRLAFAKFAEDNPNKTGVMVHIRKKQ